MKLMKLSILGLIWRFYLVMAIVIIAGFTHLWFLAILALPVFFSALMGVEFKKHITVSRKAKDEHPVAKGNMAH